MRRVLFTFLALAVTPLPAGANPLPLPEANFATTVLPSPCIADSAFNPWEVKQYRGEGWVTTPYGLERYPGACQRLRFAYGPIHVKPGQNDVLIEPITIQKPGYDGYMVRFKPDLVRGDGSVPPIEEVHLHHGTWIQLTGFGAGTNGAAGPMDFRSYGNSVAFLASGEEKTVAPLPRGYGFPVSATDQWQLLYMVHNLLSTPDEVWITYEVDFIPKAKGDALGIKPAYPIWLDVRPSYYPVFNVQTGFADADGACRWPDQQCAAFDPWGATDVVGQGMPGRGDGEAVFKNGMPARFGRIDASNGGTLIGLGGHLHPGGLSVEVDLSRPGVGRRTIFTSEAWYWDPGVDGLQNADLVKPTGPPTSWDLSMTVTGMPAWGVRMQPGDNLHISAVYDATRQSTYENMGIAVGLFAPDVDDGVDVFALPDGAFDTTTDCLDTTGGLRTGVLCTKGRPTHGRMAEAGNKGGPHGAPFDTSQTIASNEVAIAGFRYLPGDLGTTDAAGIPSVNRGDPLRFTNLDMAANVYHSVTSCQAPCNGPTGIAYPLANDPRADYDSGQLGFGPEFGPAKNALDWSLDTSDLESGTYTYFCRVHPSMRGAFQVQEVEIQ